MRTHSVNSARCGRQGTREPCCYFESTVKKRIGFLSYCIFSSRIDSAVPLVDQIDTHFLKKCFRQSSFKSFSIFFQIFSVISPVISLIISSEILLGIPSELYFQFFSGSFIVLFEKALIMFFQSLLWNYFKQSLHYIN